MWLDALAFLAGLAFLVLGGDLLVRGATRIAKRLGISDLVAGLVIVGFGTSAPELFASVEAVRLGVPQIAWGNIVGSNIANVMLILGAAALVRPFPVKPGPMWRDGGAGLLAAILLYVFARDGVVVWEGAALLLILGAYLYYAYSSERTGAHETAAGDKASAGVLADAEFAARPVPRAWKAVLFLLAGLVIIILGGNFLISGAREIALSLGMSEALVGLTIVAIGTSAPELATSVIAVRKGEGDIAFGNVVGSNIYNILAIGGVTAMLAPGSLPLLMARVELPFLIASAAVLMVLARTGWRFSRWEGALLIAGYAAYMTYAVASGT